MPADLHNQLRRGASQEFIRAKRSAASMGRYPGVFWLDYFYVFVAFLI